ncbi:MAG: DNA polymerase III subunit gamma/tau [bacterium]|jgi:DNA polymerase-3 subunit gamma/tau|nr:DNA polymerase III subunit gamma/tau [bacterium]
MSYKALYRTYRPIDFHEVSGQIHITTTLQNALKSGKVAHAYLFSGPRGTGKTSIAKIMAKTVNCEKAPIDNPCNECPSCIGIQNGMNSDVIEIDAASNNGVDEIREIRDKVKYLPGYGKFKVYIIDEVHMLSTGAFNALLKTLEEPPSHVIFILCTTEPHKIPLTIHSRCQRFDFKAISTEDIVEKLLEITQKEQIQAEEEALRQIALFAEGGMRDALSLLDQALSFSPTHIRTDDVLQISGGISYHKQQSIAIAIRQMDATKAMQILEELLVSGKEVPKIIQNLIAFYRDILIFKNIGYTEDMSKLLKSDEFERLAKAHSNKRLFFYIDVLSKAVNEMKWSTNPRLHLELALMKMTDDEPASESKLLAELARLEERIEELEKRATTSHSKIELQPEQTKPDVTLLQTESKQIAPQIDAVQPVVEPVVSAISHSEAQEETLSGSLFDDSIMDHIQVDSPIEMSQNISNTYPIEFIEEVLNNGNRQDKMYLQNSWDSILKHNNQSDVQTTAQMMSGGTVVASCEDKIIVTFSSAGICNRLMRPHTRALARTVLKNTFRRDIDVMFLPEGVFQVSSDEFMEKYRKKAPRPIRLTPITNSDLRDVSSEIDDTPIQKEQKIVSEAVRLFGDIVSVKK